MWRKGKKETYRDGREKESENVICDYCVKPRGSERDREGRERMREGRERMPFLLVMLHGFGA